MKIHRLVFLYILSLISILLVFFIIRNINNIFLSSALISIIPVIIFLLSYSLNRENKILSEKTSIRYTMHCKFCGWEWMSNISEKAPSICPNCHSKEKSEIIGWRKVVPPKPKMEERDLRNFFHP